MPKRPSSYTTFRACLNCGTTRASFTTYALCYSCNAAGVRLSAADFKRRITAARAAGNVSVIDKPILAHTSFPGFDTPDAPASHFVFDTRGIIERTTDEHFYTFDSLGSQHVRVLDDQATARGTSRPRLSTILPHLSRRYRRALIAKFRAIRAHGAEWRHHFTARQLLTIDAAYECALFTYRAHYRTEAPPRPARVAIDFYDFAARPDEAAQLPEVTPQQQNELIRRWLAERAEAAA